MPDIHPPLNNNENEEKQRSVESATAFGFESVATEAQRERSLAQVIDKIRRTLDLETIFQTTATEVRQLLQADRVAVFRFDASSGHQRGEFVSEEVIPEFADALAAQVEDHCFGDNYVHLYEQGRIWALDDIYQGKLKDCHIALLARFQVRANLVAPLRSGDYLWGLLCIHQCTSFRHWQESEIEFVAKIALNLGIAIQQAELLADLRKRSEELQTALAEVERQKEHLAEVAVRERAMAHLIEQIRRTLDLETIFRATTGDVRQLLQCDRVVVYRFYEDWNGEFLYESLGEGWRPLTWALGLKTIWNDTYLQDTQGGRYRHHETLAINDIYQASLTDCHLDILEQFQVKSFVVVPVFVGGNLWGLLGAYQQSATRVWKPTEIGLLAQVGDQLGGGVYQAQLLARTKQQSRELQTTLADLNAIVDNLADSLLVTDIFGQITRFNPALLSMFELPDGELRGKQLQDVFPSSLARLLKTAECNRAEVVTGRVELSKGREGQALITSILKDEGGDEGSQCLGSVILIRDVTREREIDRMKTEFLANVSHELRTPLTSVLGFASLIEEKLEEVIFPALITDEPKIQKAIEKVGRHIQIIVSEAERLTDLIGNVLDIAKMEAGQLDWDLKPISPFEILERAIATVEPLCSEKQLTLISQFDRDLPLIIVDENRVIQVVINLLSNAIKFTEQGSIECRAIIQEEYLLVSIRDTGVGIAVEDRALIFDRFKQVGNIFTDKPKGTGLGLPICKQIIEYHGGDIWVESQLGEGSIFYFTLPLTAEAVRMYEEMKLSDHLFEEIG